LPSARVRFFPALLELNPAASHVEIPHDTLVRSANLRPDGLGVETMVHVAPLQSSARVTEVPPTIWYHPAAMQSFAVGHETPASSPARPLGVLCIAQTLPFQASAGPTFDLVMRTSSWIGRERAILAAWSQPRRRQPGHRASGALVHGGARGPGRAEPLADRGHEPEAGGPASAKAGVLDHWRLPLDPRTHTPERRARGHGHRWRRGLLHHLLASVRHVHLTAPVSWGSLRRPHGT